MHESFIQDLVAENRYGWPRLLGDIGGTNARFGLQASADSIISDVEVLPCSEHAGLRQAIEFYLESVGRPCPAYAALGIANPVVGDEVRMTNLDWSFSISALREELKLHRLLVINDFTALALAIPDLSPACKRQVGPGNAIEGAAVGLIGAGTGLGVSGLIPLGASNPVDWWPISGEGGHVTLSAATQREFDVILHLQKRYGHVSAERVLSGPGLVDLYHALLDVHHKSGIEVVSAAQVMQRANSHPESTANEAVDMFCAFLGSVAGDLALTIGARGGVYIGGGIVPKMGARFDNSPFRTRFESKGRFSAYLAEVPTWVVDSPVSPALAGASKALSLVR